MGDNMKEFNDWVAIILERLYSKFPIEDDFEASKITEEEEYEKNKLFNGTMQFLRNEGFVRFDDLGTMGSFGYSNIVLTAKGLALLNSVPNSLEEKTPFISKIKGAMKSGSSTAVSAVIQGLIKAQIS
jgi:hypothetical protein